MAKVTQRCAESPDRPVFICDFSPPRGGDPALLDGAKSLDADFLCVAYSPGKAVRVDSAMAAHVLRRQMGKEVVFTQATRDMNRLAIQSHLLGASLLGLENVIVIGGDPFTERDLATVKEVNDFTSTELIAAIKSMNQGRDFRGLKLRSPTDFCVGATVDLGREVDREARLAHRKVSAGADFLVTQPVYSLDQVEGFRERYESVAGEGLLPPTFFGLQVLEVNGLTFGDVPERFRVDLDKGRTGTDIAIEMLHDFVAGGVRNIYLISPILRGGRRDYKAAQRVLEASRGL
ncbi:MAG: bifunctional homocysteine S-methyltransferase/methylenetetrahydrofolate reductase [Dehalococcoidia bacterium]|nr:bifunctional homocysteine S-methyltransferase/methylenetetrahydrofolate reductase [Dehalococcoidia bacterium]